MDDAVDQVYRVIDETNAEQPAATRRQMVAGAAAALGGLGLLGLPGVASANHVPTVISNKQRVDDVAAGNVQTILNIATTAEVLATIVNTVGAVGSQAADGTRVGPVSLPRDGTQKISASAVQELGHYNVLKLNGGQEVTERIWIPNAVFANATNFLTTLEVGDQIFVNAYLIAITSFGKAGQGDLARVAAEFMGVEAVHRAFARDLRGVQGNDRMFMKFDQREEAPGLPAFAQRGFTEIEGAVAQLQAAGFGFGQQGASPGRFYDFRRVARDTPNPSFVNTREVE